MADTELLLSKLAGDFEGARQRYAKFMGSEDLGEGKRTPVLAPGFRHVDQSGGDPLNEPCAQERYRTVVLDKLAENASKKFGVKSGLLESPTRLRTVVIARREFIRHALRQGYRLAEIARYLRRTIAGIIKLSRSVVVDD